MKRSAIFLLFVLTAWATHASAQTPFYQGKTITIIVSTKAGDVYDLYPRLVAEFMPKHIPGNPNIIIQNVPGAAGTIGLARFVGAERGNGDVLLVSGLIMLGGIVTYDSPVTLADAVPIARVTGEYEALAVPASSPFRTLEDLLAAFRADPESISWGGGSVGGSAMAF